MFEGSPVEVVRAMLILAWPAASLPLPGNIDWAVANGRKFLGIEMKVAQGSEEEIAAAFVDEMLWGGLAARR